MKKNNLRLISVIAVFMLAIVGSLIAQEAIIKWRAGQDATGAEHRIGHRYPLPVQEQAIEDITATSSVEIGTTVAVKCPTLHANTRVLLVGTIGDALNFGDSTVPTGANYPFAIASGSYKAYNVTTTTPDLYFRGATASATVHFLQY